MNSRLDKEKQRLLNQFYTLETTISQMKNSFDSISGSLAGAVSLAQSIGSSSKSN
jgi:flagellar capping protein FliD